MHSSRGCVISVTLVAAAMLFAPAASAARQNETPGRPQTPGRPTSGNQSPAAPGNQTPAKPAEPPPVAGTPLYISPGIVLQIQQKLLTLGYPVPTLSGAWGDNSAAALGQFQQKLGLDAGGDLDELTLAALDMAQVLKGELPPGGDAAVSASAIASGGAPLAASPRLTRVVQNKLADAGFPPHNVFGIWVAAIDNAPRNFQKAKGLDITNTLDLQVIHALGVTDSLTNAKPGKLPTDHVVAVLSDKAVILTGTPLTVSAHGVRQVQTALVQRGHKDVIVDGKWSDAVTGVLKKFQEAQKLEPTGSINLRTLRALGFNNPLNDLDRPTPAPSKPTK
ncbi:MAG: peptidoglycan-binding protein [Acidobacteria bacterium]|nr:peptidoglycan-binding protein [Acidobacteriota bacterium]